MVKKPTEKKPLIKIIKIDIDKCNGCRACEIVCSAFHASPRFGMVNPLRSRIRVFSDPENNQFVPTLGGPFTEKECDGRHVILIKGRKYGTCSFCRASCASRELFREPDAEIPLKCDLCGNPMPEGGPRCVQWCLNKALTYIERSAGEGEIIHK